MATKSPDKEVKKALNGLRAVRTDFYTIGKVQAAVTLVMAAVMLLGLLMNLATKNPYVQMVGFVLVLVGAAVILVFYLIVRAKGPLNYTVYFFRDKKGRNITLQIVGKKRLHFTVDGTMLGYEHSTISAGATPYRDDVPWNWFDGVTFVDAKDVNSRERRYYGEFNGKKATISLRNGKIDYAEAGGLRMRYLSVGNLKNGEAIVPEDFYEAVMELGFEPDDLPFMTTAKH